MSLKIIQLDDKEELVQLIRQNCTMIEKGIENLGGPLGTEDLPQIDLVAKGKNGRPLLIFADVRPDENALLNAAAQTDWFVRNRSLLRQLFQDLSIDKSAPPRAALIYPEFSFTSPDVECAGFYRHVAPVLAECVFSSTVFYSGWHLPFDVIRAGRADFHRLLFAASDYRHHRPS